MTAGTVESWEQWHKRIPTLVWQKQVDCYKFGASLVYIENSLPGLHSETVSINKENPKTKQASKQPAKLIISI